MHVPVSGPTLGELLTELDTDRLRQVIFPVDRPAMTETKYLHWDDVLHLTPPDDLTAHEWWLRIKWARASSQRPLPLRDAEGSPFTFIQPDAAFEQLHTIDQQASGRIAMSDSITNPATRDRYVITSLIEEAITSSQLEGASTTRRVAKEMLRIGREPRDRSEQMIFNNYQAMQFVSANRDREMTPEFLFDIHRTVTRDTLENSDAAGRLQRTDEQRVRVWHENTVLHTPPPADTLAERLDAFCTFANSANDGPWLHPVIRSIVLHFWLGYDHYFEDGNGRTARAVFYWAMLSQGYWVTEFLTISTILRKAPVRYAQKLPAHRDGRE